jgi:hypothetical protein
MVVVAVVAVVIYDTKGSGSHTPVRQDAAGSMNLGLVAGESQRGVLRRLGPPSSKREGCWIYRTTAGNFRGTYVGRYIDAVRFCFIGSVLSDIEDHWNLHDSKGPRWLPPVEFSTDTSTSPT